MSTLIPNQNTEEISRLLTIGDKYKPEMRLAYTRGLMAKKDNAEGMRAAASKALLDTVESTAYKYSVEFNPNRLEYSKFLDRFIEDMRKDITPESVQSIVRITPAPGRITKIQMGKLAYGLDYMAARQLIDELYGTASIEHIRRKFTSLSQIRLNLLANRAIDKIVKESWFLLFKTEGNYRA